MGFESAGIEELHYVDVKVTQMKRKALNQCESDGQEV